MRASPHTQPRKVPGWVFLLALPAITFLIALNPWFSPEQHDDVTYFFGAKSIAETGKFALDGTPITDWPPVFPAILAAARLVAGGSTIVAKLVVLAFVIGGVFAIRRVAINHHFAHPSAIAAITCLLPISIICGANILSEWPFLTFSLLFILSLQHLENSRSGRWILTTGLVLAIASLTRFSGVLLGVAIVVQAITRLRVERRLRSITPEFLVAIIGAIPWLLWKLRCTSTIARGEAPSGAYDNAGYYLDRFTNFNLTGLFSKTESTLISASRAASHLTGSSSIAALIVGLFTLALVSGAIIQFRRHGIRPADWYVLANLALLLGDLFQPERYFLPIAPFLVGYVTVSISALAEQFGTPRSRQVFASAIGIWIAVLLALDCYLLFKGNSDGSRGGQSMLASPDIETFYHGKELDLYRAIQFADRQAPAAEAIGAAGFHGKYLLALGGRSFQNFPYGDFRHVTWMVKRPGTEATDGPVPPEWQLVEAFGKHQVYQRKKL